MNVVNEKEEQAKAMVSQGIAPKEIAYKTGLSLMWIELQYKKRGV